MFLYEERDYLQEQTIAETVKNAFLIYREHFRKFFFSYFLLMFPATLLGAAATIGLSLAGATGIGVLAYFTITFFMSTVASVVVTLIVCDICLGTPPSAKRAFKHLSVGLLLRLLLSTLLFYLIISVILLVVGMLLLTDLPLSLSGWILLIVVGLLLLVIMAVMTSFIFYPTIVVLESRWGFGALRRSATLGYGYHIRNFVIVCLMSGVVTVIPYLLYVTFSLIVKAPEWAPLGLILYYILGFLIQPLNLIYIVLLYYDLRVRKEGLDSAALDQDLTH